MDIEYLKQMIVNINSSLPYYEKDYISVKRTPLGDKERVESFRQFIECRLNFECFSIPELRPYAEAFDGHLFEVTAVYDQDEARRRFSMVQAELCKSSDTYIGDQDFLDSIDEVEDILGGSTLKFNYSQKKTKIYIE